MICHIKLFYSHYDFCLQTEKSADKAVKHACNHLNSRVPYSDTKSAISSFMKNKWQRQWEGYTENKLNNIKPGIAIWHTFSPKKIYVIFTRLRIGHSRLIHRHLLLDEEEPACPHCHFSVLTRARN